MIGQEIRRGDRPRDTEREREYTMRRIRYKVQRKKQSHRREREVDFKENEQQKRMEDGLGDERKRKFSLAILEPIHETVY